MIDNRAHPNAKRMSLSVLILYQFLFLFKLFVLLVSLSSPKVIASDIVKVSPEVEARIKNLFNNDAKLVIVPHEKQLLSISLSAKTFFASADGRYLFAGPVIDTESMQNISELKSQEYRAKRMATLDKAMYLSYPASNERESVTLFTDIDCGYCRKFHTQIEAFNAAGITVNYVMLPRSGMDSPSFTKTLSVLCSKNPQQNMTLAMQGQYFGLNRCVSTLPQQLELAQELGIQNTPSMVLPDGRLKLGLMSPEQVKNLLALNSSPNQN